MTIGSRLKQRRLSLGYTLENVRELLIDNGVNISKAALSKYELDKSVPKATILFNLCEVLNVSSEYFLKKLNFEINWIAFRKTSKFSKKEENRIKFVAKEQVEAQLFLDDIVKGKYQEYTLPQYSINTLDEADEAASKLRKEWEINNWPIESLTSLLEEKSVFIVDVESKAGFDGLSGKIDDKKPIIITIGENSVDRKRLSVAHELGHLILKTNDLDNEKAAFRFAASFLIQKESIFNVIGEKRRRIDIRELQILKEEYGISIQALIRRCYDLKVINESEYRRLNIYMRTNGLHINEPGKCKNKEKPTMIKSRLLRAVSEGLTTESEVLSRFPNLAAEINREEMVYSWNEKSDIEKNQILEESASALFDEYSEGGTLEGFELHDDILDM